MSQTRAVKKRCEKIVKLLSEGMTITDARRRIKCSSSVWATYKRDNNIVYKITRAKVIAKKIEPLVPSLVPGKVRMTEGV